MLYTDPIVVHAPPSAYGKVGWRIFQAVKDKHEVAHTPMGGCNQIGRFKWGDLTMYESGSAVDGFGEDVIERNCYHFNSDLVLVLKDLFAFNRLHTMPLECAYYVPVDHEDLHPHIETVLKTAFKVIAMSRFGEYELKRKKIKVDAVIPHDVDPKIYRPAEGMERENCKRFFKLDPHKFCIGFLGRNQVRKQIPRFLQVVRRLLDSNPDLEKEIQVLLWTDVYARYTAAGAWRGTQLIPVMMHLGLTDKIAWPVPEAYNEGIPKNEMWRFYNACDVVCGVGNEGFWLPGIEAACCGIPTVHVNYAAAPEVSQFTAKIEDWIFQNPAGLKQPLVDLDDMADKILHVYNSDWEALRRKQLERAKDYHWEKIAPQWIDFMNRIELELRPLVCREGVRKWDKKLE